MPQVVIFDDLIDADHTSKALTFFASFILLINFI